MLSRHISVPVSLYTGDRLAQTSHRPSAPISLPVISPYTGIRPAQNGHHSVARNHIVGSGICTPPPHLRPFITYGVVLPRQTAPSNTSTTLPLRPCLPTQNPNQTVPSNPTITSRMHPRLPAQNPTVPSNLTITSRMHPRVLTQTPRNPIATSRLHPRPPQTP